MTNSVVDDDDLRGIAFALVPQGSVLIRHWELGVCEYGEYSAELGSPRILWYTPFLSPEAGQFLSLRGLLCLLHTEFQARLSFPICFFF